MVVVGVRALEYLRLDDSVPAIAFREYNQKRIIVYANYYSDVNALTQRVINKRYEKKT